MKKIVTILLFLSLSSLSATCLAAPGKSDDILELFKVTGALKLGEQFGAMSAKQMIHAMQENNNDIPTEAYPIIEEETITLLKEHLAPESEFVKELISIYDDYFTHDDIKDLLEFYRTEIGRKLIASMPHITERSLLAGHVWGNSFNHLLQQRIHARFEEEGIQMDL